MKNHLLPLISLMCCPVLMSLSKPVAPQFDAKGQAQLEMPLKEAWSCGCTFTVSHYPDGGLGLFNEVSPLSLMHVMGPGRDPSVLVRLNKRKLEIVVFEDGPALQVVSGVEYVLEGEKCQVAVVVKDNQLKAYLNGRFQLKIHSGKLSEAYTRLARGHFWGNRRFQGELTDLWYSGETQDEAAIQAACPREIAARPPHEIHSENFYGIYKSLKIKSEQPHTWHDMHDVLATPLAWHDARGRDLLVYSPSNMMMGTRTALFRFLRLDKASGMPIYDAGKTLDNLPGGRFQVYRRQDGSQELFSMGNDTMFGPTSLIVRKITGQGETLSFGKPQEVVFAGGAAVPGTWFIHDVNGNDTPDLFFARTHYQGAGWPHNESPWQNKELQCMGPGRGYDLAGNWLGTESIYEFCMARGQRDEQGRLSFGQAEVISYHTPGFPLQWKTYSFSALAAYRENGQLKLLLQGNIDELRCVDLTFVDGRPVADNPQPFLQGGAKLRNGILTRRLSFVDFDLDGQPELMTDGNFGRLCIIKRSTSGEYTEVGCALMQGGALASDTLVSPCRVDWDGDGVEDLLLGDAAGNILFWKGTSNPLVYEAARCFTVNGVPLVLQAGPTGSIQGVSERRWGYAKVMAADWDGDGQPEMIVNDIRGRMVLYRKVPGDNPLALTEAQPFMYQEAPLAVAWRTRPDVVPLSVNFHGCGCNALLFTDWDGDACVGIPEKPGSLTLGKLVKLRYEDGSTVRLCGVCGHWGRSATSVVDFDGDGRWDIVLGTNGNCHPAISRPNAQIPRGLAMPILLRNVGTNENPVFAEPRPVTLADGALLNFHTHCATPWFTDLNHDGVLDMLIGSEDGKVYYFLRSELQ